MTITKTFCKLGIHKWHYHKRIKMGPETGLEEFRTCWWCNKKQSKTNRKKWID